MVNYRSLQYAEISQICETPRILAERFTSDDKDSPAYICTDMYQREMVNERGIKYNALNFTFTGQDGEDEYQKNLYYVYRETGVLLRMETNEKNNVKHGAQHSYYENGKLWTEEYYKDGMHEGLRVLYKNDGSLDKVGLYHENKQLCDMTLKLKAIQFGNSIRAVFGIKRRDPETLIHEQFSALKKRHPTLAW